ncbi:MAG: hypothetical protein ACREUL_09105 [Steroidobacteraceae bacterium]
MSRHKSVEEGFGKALALWESPAGAGDPRVCIASTFTFRADFFETECLGRFLGMDAHPAESDAVSYMVEREEKLAAARVAVLVDRRHAREKESLRWDVLGALLHGACQHSKIALLAWANHVRVIVGSGNLTDPGYRKNLEVFGTLDLSRKNGGDAESVRRVLDFLNELIDSAVGVDSENAPKHRARGALSSVRSLIRNWPNIHTTNPILVLGGSGRAVLGQLEEAWPSNSPPRRAYVVSPFFDCDGTDTANALIHALAKRRPREIYFDVRTETGSDGHTRVFAPLPMIQHAAARADVFVRRVLPEQNGEFRDLHAKMIYLESDDCSLVLIGSSNFTRAGLGVSGKANFEANLAYRARASEPEGRILEKLWPAVDDDWLDIESAALVWDPQPDESDDDGRPALPACFEEAMFAPGSDPSLVIVLRDPLPNVWSISADGAKDLLLSSAHSGSGRHVIPWQRAGVPFVLEVTWSHRDRPEVANWPVNVSNPAMLPPPEALRSLTLEELLLVLSSTRPIPQAVAEVLAKRKGEKGDGNAHLDPLKRFDSQSFVLRRTKRLAAALERLHERLERSASSREAYEWRLFGPVGPMALAESYVREAASTGEARFCVAEIALTLGRVQPAKVALDGLPATAVAEYLSKAVQKLAENAAILPAAPGIDRYATAAFEHVT